MTLLLIALGAGIGAPARYLADRAIQSRHRTMFPWGTVTVNLVASLLLGVITGAELSAEATLLLGTGFCGTLSTYSAFSYETLRLGQRGAGWLAAGNVGLSLAGGVAAATLGWWLGTSLR